MVTYTQLGQGCRVSQNNFTWTRQLFKCPQASGRIVKILSASPKKPNSAKRKTAKMILSNRKLIFAKMMGEGYIPQKYGLVLVRGRGFKDTPQVNYTMIRGALECLPVFDKKRRRSHFGVSSSDQIAMNETSGE